MCSVIKGIVHIADLHIEDSNGLLDSRDFVDDLCDAINKIKVKNERVNIDTLLVNGDLADKGGNQNRYKKIVKLLKKIIEKTNIKNLIITPGNHDVSRNVLLGIEGNDGIDKDKLWQYKEEKFKYFNTITNLIQDKESEYKIDVEFNLDINKCIVSKKIFEEEKIIILGISSVDKNGKSDEEGHVDEDALRMELEELKSSTREYDQYLKIIAFHHRPIPYISNVTLGESNQNTSGTFNKVNWCGEDGTKGIKKILKDFEINVVLTGHVHGNQVQIIDECEDKESRIYYSTVGGLGTNFNKETISLFNKFNLDKLGSEEKKIWEDFKGKVESNKCLAPLYNYHNSFSVIKIKDRKILVEEQYKYFKDEGRGKWLLWDEKYPHHKPISNEDANLLENSSPFANPVDATEDKEVISAPKIDKDECAKELIQIIKDNKLYKTGHFHRAGGATLAWIDTSYLLTKKRELYYVCKAMNDIYEEVFRKSECIIGIGMKGNILMNGIRYQKTNLNKVYTYYPDTEEAHIKYEKEVTIKDSSLYSNILVLTDVVNSGTTIEKFIEKNKAMLEKTCEINIISILSTNSYEVSLDIDNFKIRFHELAKISIPACTLNKQCNIPKQQLVPVYQM